MFHRQFTRKGIQKPGFCGEAGLLLAALLFCTLGPPHVTLGEDGADAIARLDHLLQAATHLEKAGRTDLAAEIYSQLAAQAEADRQRLAETKLAQIKQLEIEIARLRTSPLATNQSLPPSGEQVVVEAKVIELALERLQASGLSLVSIRNLLDSSPSSAVVDEDGRIREFMELLRREGLVQVLAAPKLATISGHSATVEIGGPDSIALRLACTPKITAPGKLSLAIDLRHQRPVVSPGFADRAESLQAAGTLEVRTEAELRSGATLVVAGVRESGGAKGNCATLLLVTATIVGSQGKPPAP